MDDLNKLLATLSLEELTVVRSLGEWIKTSERVESLPLDDQLYESCRDNGCNLTELIALLKGYGVITEDESRRFGRMSFPKIYRPTHRLVVLTRLLDGPTAKTTFKQSGRKPRSEKTTNDLMTQTLQTKPEAKF